MTTRTTTVSRDQLVSVLTIANADWKSIQGDYSAPWMCGATCAAVTLDRVHMLRFMAVLGAILFDEGDGDYEEVMEVAEAAQFDSLGSNTVVYFPGVQLADA